MYGRNVNVRFGGPLTPVVKKLLIINAAIFIVQQFLSPFQPGVMENLFGLSHTGFIHQFKLWQPFTYMFLHGGWFHIIFNCIAIWMFAGELEELWGSSFFLRYYLYSGVGAGIFIALMNYITYNQYGGVSPVTIGASGAIYALLLGYGLNWPNREVLLYFIIPVKIKYLLIFFGVVEFFGTLSSVTGAAGNISHIGHLGGLFSGFIFLKFSQRKSRTGITKSKKNEGVVGSALKKARLKKKKNEIDTRIKAKKIIDDLLEKIAREGMSSLTPDEKKKLEWARKHYYPDGNHTVH